MNSSLIAISQFARLYQKDQQKQNLMNKNSLVNILFEKNIEKQEQKNLYMSHNFNRQKFTGIFEYPKQKPSKCIHPSNKMIKITQFSSSIVIDNDKLYQRTMKSTPSNSPTKNFTIKKFNQFRAKIPLMNNQKFIEIQVKKKDRAQSQHKESRHEQPKEDYFIKKQIKKLLVTSKWSLNQEMASLIPNVQKNQPHFAQETNQKHSSTQIHEQNKRLDCTQNNFETKQYSKPPNLFQNNTMNFYSDYILDTDSTPAQIKYSNSPDRESINGTTLEQNITDKKYATSPRKHYSKHLKQQKNYQQNIEREKRELLEMRKELNKNYAKPFTPPENVTAFSYIIYEMKGPTNKSSRRFSAKKHDIVHSDMLQTRRVFLHSNQIVVSLNSKTAVEIASLTKIMTCIVALQIASKNLRFLQNETINVGLFEQSVDGTSANIKKGQIYTLEQLLYGLMLPSGNDASLAIAVWGGRVLLHLQSSKEQNNQRESTCNSDQRSAQKSGKFKKRQCYARFVKEMNSKAKQLNMEKTKYSNSHGLSDPQNRSCAFDLAILCEYAMKNEIFQRIVSCKEYECQIKVQKQQSDTLNKNTSRKNSRKQLINNSESNLNKKIELYEMEEMKDCIQQKRDEQPIQEDQQTKTSSKKYISKSIKWQNTHQLLQQKSSIYLGIKTGVTATAGPCLASCIQTKCKRKYILIVLGCKSMKFRFKDTQLLRKWLANKAAVKFSNKQDSIVAPAD